MAAPVPWKVGFRVVDLGDEKFVNQKNGEKNCALVLPIRAHKNLQHKTNLDMKHGKVFLYADEIVL